MHRLLNAVVSGALAILLTGLAWLALYAIVAQGWQLR